MKTPIADMIAEMHGKGIPVELIVSAVARIEEAMAARAVSTGIPVDTSTIDKRRAWDRERKRRQRDHTRASTGQDLCPPDSTGLSTGRGRIPPDFPPDSGIASSNLEKIRGFQEAVEEKKVSKKKESNLLRGSRIPPDFHLDAEDYEFAAALGFPPDITDSETEQFKDFWIGVPGAKGVKLNWRATWRNRMRDLKKYRDSRGQSISNHRANNAAGRATARETHHVAAVGGAALRYLREGKSAGSGGAISNGADTSQGFDAEPGAKGHH